MIPAESNAPEVREALRRVARHLRDGIPLLSELSSLELLALKAVRLRQMARARFRGESARLQALYREIRSAS